MKRYIPKYAGKEGFEERFVVLDTYANEELSPPRPYHAVNDECDARNNGTFGVEAIAAWCSGLNLPSAP